MEDRPLQTSPILGVSTLVRDGGRILLVRRGKPPFVGLWSLPGGRVEMGEALAAAAGRELREETGVLADGFAPIDVVEVINSGGADDTADHFVLVVFRGEYRSGSPVAGDDAADARWVDPMELPALPLTEQTRDILSRHVEIHHAG